MKKLLILFTLTITLSTWANTDITITINSNEKNLTPVASGTFLATKDSIFCTDFSWNDGSPTRVPERRYPQFYEEDGILTVPFELNSRCDFKRTGASLGFKIKNYAKTYNVVDIYVGGGDLNPQEIECKEIISGPSGNKGPYIVCYGDITTNDNGEAIVDVLFK